MSTTIVYVCDVILFISVLPLKLLLFFVDGLNLYGDSKE